MENEYKPILVLYLPNEMSHNEKDVILKDISERFGYNTLAIPITNNKDCRAEIISVDKATIVEDIQKYIDTKMESKNEEIPDIDTTTYTK